jgi:hypothetical protein
MMVLVWNMITEKYSDEKKFIQEHKIFEAFYT